MDTGRRKGLTAWLTTTDHKRSACCTSYAMTCFFLVGMSIGFVMRLVQLTSFHNLITAQTYNALFTVHGVIMIFLFVIPGLPAVFGNFFLPILIGARDVAFPRLNLLSWYFFMAGAALAVTVALHRRRPARHRLDLLRAVQHQDRHQRLAGGVRRLRARLLLDPHGHQLHHHHPPPARAGHDGSACRCSAWALYATAWVQVLATPIIAITLVLVILERVFGIGIFDPAKGGDPILYQHLFWIYSHPAVYIMILPAMGAITEIIPTFARRTIFGYKAIAFSSHGHRRRRIPGVGPPHVHQRHERRSPTWSSRC